MEPHTVVEDFDVFEDSQAGFGPGGKGAPGEDLGFVAGVHLLAGGVVAGAGAAVNSTRMPRRSHQRLSRERPGAPLPPKGGPLSTRMAAGIPSRWKRRVVARRAAAALWSGRSRISIR